MFGLQKTSFKKKLCSTKLLDMKIPQSIYELLHKLKKGAKIFCMCLAHCLYLQPGDVRKSFDHGETFLPKNVSRLKPF